jgi:hypothetical protein
MIMRILKSYIVKMPDYALPYLINGDDSGLNESDKIAIDNYMTQFYAELSDINDQIIFDYDSELESYFTWNPAFGLTCNVVDFTIAIMK